jgi:hypothetical protein
MAKKEYKNNKQSIKIRIEFLITLINYFFGIIMKIKCHNIYNQQTKQYQEKSECLTLGKEYIVLETMVSA